MFEISLTNSRNTLAAYSAMLLSLCSLLLLLLFSPHMAIAQRVQDDAKPNTSKTAKNSNAKAGSFSASPSSRSGYTTSIIAIVNDSVITSTDVAARLRLAIISSGLPDNEETRRQLSPQILQTLIDEQLQLGEGAKQSITISQNEIDEALKRISSENNIPGNDIIAFLSQNGVPSFTLINQLKASLTWGRIVQRTIRPRVEIGDDEVETFVDRIKANAGKNEYLISEIFLPVESTADEDKVNDIAKGLMKRIRSGARFGAVARQFSSSFSAAQGGDMGWILQGQLPAELDKSLKNLESGMMAGPIRTTDGFYIIGLRDKRVVSLPKSDDSAPQKASLGQLFLPFKAGIGRDVMTKKAQEIRQSIKITPFCKDITSQINRDFPDWRWRDLGEVNLATAPKWIANEVSTISSNNIGEPRATSEGILLLVVCKKQSNDGIDRMAIQSTIGTEKLTLAARRLLRDLRRNAWIQIKEN